MHKSYEFNAEHLKQLYNYFLTLLSCYFKVDALVKTMWDNTFSALFCHSFTQFLYFKTLLFMLNYEGQHCVCVYGIFPGIFKSRPTIFNLILPVTESFPLQLTTYVQKASLRVSMGFVALVEDTHLLIGSSTP